MYVAVVCTKDYTSRRSDGDHACFISENKDEAIRKALKVLKQWDNNPLRGYHILVGQLTHKVDQPVRYDLYPIGDM